MYHPCGCRGREQIPRLHESLRGYGKGEGGDLAGVAVGEVISDIGGDGM